MRAPERDPLAGAAASRASPARAATRRSPARPARPPRRPRARRRRSRSQRRGRLGRVAASPPGGAERVAELDLARRRPVEPRVADQVARVALDHRPERVAVAALVGVVVLQQPLGDGQRRHRPGGDVAHDVGVGVDPMHDRRRRQDRTGGAAGAASRGDPRPAFYLTRPKPGRRPRARSARRARPRWPRRRPSCRRRRCSAADRPSASQGVAATMSASCDMSRAKTSSKCARSASRPVSRCGVTRHVDGVDDLDRRVLGVEREEAVDVAVGVGAPQRVDVDGGSGDGGHAATVPAVRHRTVNVAQR